jgi:hypothetical protein
MKKSIVLVMGALFILALNSCQKVPKADFGQVLAMNISLEKDVLQKSNSNILTLTVENTSNNKIIIPNSTFILEFTSYSGSIRKNFYIDPFNGAVSNEILQKTGLEIKGNSALLGEIDLSKILFNSQAGEQVILPSDDYTVNLIINFKPELNIAESNEIIRSNYTDLQVEG